jgi:hypothetical protein
METLEHLGTIEVNVLALEQDPGNREVPPASHKKPGEILIEDGKAEAKKVALALRDQKTRRPVFKQPMKLLMSLASV